MRPDVSDAQVAEWYAKHKETLRTVLAIYNDQFDSDLEDFCHKALVEMP